jgi:hypothetical protein
VIIAILFFISKVFDLITTRIFLAHGIKESNFLYNKYGEDFSFFLVYALTFVIYLVVKYAGKYEEVKEILILYIAISFIVPIFNLITTFLIK